MRVQNRLLFLSGILGILFLAGFYFINQAQINNIKHLIAGERGQVQQLFNKLVSLEGEPMEMLVFDYTYWDELVDFVKTRDASFAANTLDESLKGYDVDAIWVFTPQFEPVYFTSRSTKQEDLAFPLSAAQVETAFAGTAFTHFYYQAPAGFLIEVRGATIHPTADVAHATPGQGYMFVGRIWDAERLTLLSELTGSQVTVAPPTGPPSAGADVMDDILVDYPVYGFDGALAAYLVGRFENQFAEGFQIANQRDILLYLFFALGLLLVEFIGLSWWIMRPVKSLSTSLTKETTAPLRKLVTERSEFGHIARLIQSTFDQREVMAAAIQRHESTELALRESEERYRIVTELTSDAAYAVRTTGTGKITFEWGEEGVARLTGFPAEAIDTLEKIQSVIYPDDWSAVASQLQAIAEGIPAAIEFRMLNGRGKVRWLRNHIYPVRDANSGAVTWFYGALQDISAEKNAQEAYHTLVDNSPFGLAIYQDGAICFANLALMRMTGYSGEELLSLTEGQILSLIHPGDRIGVDADIQLAFQDEQGISPRELRLRFKDGAWHWVDVSAVRIEYQSRPALQITFHDVSDRRRAEQALDQQQQYSTAILNTVEALVMVLDPHGTVVSCNPAGLALLRLQNQDLYGKSLWDVINVEDTSPIAPKNFAALVASGTTVHDVDLFVRHPEGRVWLTWSQTYLTGDDGNVTAVIGTANDISERKIRERQRESIAAIASAVRASSTRREIAQATLQAINEFLQVESVAVGFPDANLKSLKLEFVTGALKQRLEGQQLPIDEGISGEVFHSGKPYLTNDLQNERHFYTKDLLESLTAAAWVPMVVDGAVTGVILIGSSRPIDQAEFAALIPIADMAAGAIHRAKLADQMQQRLQQLTALRALNISIGSSFDLNVTLNVLVNQVHSHLGVDAVCVLLLEPDTRLLKYAAGSGFRSPAIEQLTFWAGEGLAGRTTLERHTQHVYDPEGLVSYFEQREWLVGENFVAYYAVPMIVKGEVKGVLETFHRAPFTPQPDFQQLLEALAQETAIAIDKAELMTQLQISNQDLIIAYDKTIEGWARALELRDEETEGHTRRVAECTMRLAQAYGITGDRLMHIRRGALLHDLGKIAIPDRILLKPSDLSPEEWEIMRQHPRLAYEMLSSIEFLRPALDIPYCHHEHWDGSGYPRGLAGEEIPVAARLFSVIDIWDALRHKRPYRDAWPEEQVVAHIKEQAGKILDPEIVRIFLEIRPLIIRQGG